MANDYYTHGAYPSTGAPGRSADMRSEMDAISAGFNKCPPLLGSAFKVPYCVAGETNYAVVGGNGMLKLSTTGIPSIAVADVDYATPGATNAGLAALDARKIERTAPAGSAVIPPGTTAERDATPATGYMRFNTTLQQFEGFYNGSWQSVGGGQLLGNAVTKAIFYNAQTIAEDLTVGTGRNGGTFGPVSIADGFSVTVADGSVWSIV